MNKLEELRKLKASIALGGGQKKIDAQHASGKLTARERLNILFDREVLLRWMYSYLIGQQILIWQIKKPLAMVSSPDMARWMDDWCSPLHRILQF